MKLSTYVLALFHAVYVVGFMWLGPWLILMYRKNRAWMLWWLLCSLVMIGHWYLPMMKQECVLAYLEKRREDPSYVLGSEPYKSYVWVLFHEWTGLPVRDIFAFHRLVSKVMFLLAVSVVTLLNNPGGAAARGSSSSVLLYVVLTAWALEHVY